MIDRCVKYSKGYKYQVKENFVAELDIVPSNTINISFVSLTKDGLLTVYTGYAWNGASGPTWDTKNSMRGSLVHDVGYQLIRLGHLPPSAKEYFDQLLYDLCVEDGMFKWRASYWKWAVLKFGIGSTRPSAEPKVLVAP